MPWRAARVDRAGTTLTVFVNPPKPGCQTYPSPHASVQESSDVVIVTVTATAAPAACERTVVTQFKVTLSQPLGGRLLRNGRDGVIARAFFDANLPVIPAAWHEVPTDYISVDQSSWSIGFTRSGGPDLYFRAEAFRMADPGTVPLGSHKGVVYPVRQDSYGVRWQVGDLMYSMELMPSEGKTCTQAELEHVISQLTWP